MKKYLGNTARNWLLTFYILFLSIWLGSALFTILIRLYNQTMQSDETLTTLHILSNKSDMLIIPSGIGVLITAVMIATMTKCFFYSVEWL